MAQNTHFKSVPSANKTKLLAGSKNYLPPWFRDQNQGGVTMNYTYKDKQTSVDEILPVYSFLKPISRFDGLYPKNPDENEAYWDFISWAMNREHEVLLSIPTSKREDFWLKDFDETGIDLSAFNTIDFQRLYPDQFDKHKYRIMKIYEKVKDFAQTHSCLLTQEGRKNIRQKFIDLVDAEIRDNAKKLLKQIQKKPYRDDKESIIERIQEANARIRRCKAIWEAHAEVA